MRSTLALGLFVLLFGLAPGCQTSSWFIPSAGLRTISPDEEAQAQELLACARICWQPVGALIDSFLPPDDPARKVKAERFAAGETLGEHLVGEAMIFAVRRGLPLAQVRLLFGEPRAPCPRSGSLNDRMAECLLETSEHFEPIDYIPPVSWKYHQYGVRVEMERSRSEYIEYLRSLPLPMSTTYERVNSVMEP